MHLNSNRLLRFTLHSAAFAFLSFFFCFSSASLANSESLFYKRFFGESYSRTQPLFRKRTLSELMMVLRRWAIVRTVAPPNSSPINF